MPLIAGLLAFGLTLSPLRAEQFGLFSYRVEGDAITITGYDTEAVGPVMIPDEIVGRPVVRIAGGEQSCAHFPFCNYGAFHGCFGITSVAIPSGVTHIGRGAFDYCGSLTSIEVSPENTTFSSDGGSLFNRNGTVILRCPGGTEGHFTIPGHVTGIGASAFKDCRRLTSVSIPDSITSIGVSAFRECAGLTAITIPEGITSIAGAAFSSCSGLVSVTIPDSVTSIGPSAFSDCSGLASISLPEGLTSMGEFAFSGCGGLVSITIPDSVTSIGSRALSYSSELTSAVFLGDAPIGFSPNVFDNTASNFAIYYRDGGAGFTSPNWNGYPAFEIDDADYPTATWLLTHGLSHDTDLEVDLNGDGVSLLLAYGLDLDPNLNLRASLPFPGLSQGTLRMTFHAASPGINYTVETSTDLRTWTTDGVTLSDLDADNHRTASVNLDLPRRFLRLVVSETP